MFPTSLKAATRRVEAIVAAMHVEGVRLLDWSLDPDHNRSVVTIAGTPAGVVEAAVRAAGRASELSISPRRKASIPASAPPTSSPSSPFAVSPSSSACCSPVRPATKSGSAIRFPVYFYEAAAARPDRALLEEVRRGQFEGLRDAVIREPARRPDVGGPSLHPTAGASAVGARRFLIAFNLFLDTPEVSVARAIAKDIRQSGGGLAGVKAMGVSAQSQAQVSMNITDFTRTPVGEVYAAVKEKARRHGAAPVRAELIGLIPEAALERNSEWLRLLDDAGSGGFDPEQKVLERRLDRPLPWPSGL